MLAKIFNQFNQSAVKLSSNTLILSLRESYIALIPFFIVASVITLLNQWFDIADKGGSHEFLNTFNTLVWALFPLITLLSFSYYLSKNLKLHSIASPVLVMVCFAASTGYIIVNEAGIHIDSKGGVLYSILMPIFCCYILHYFASINALKLVGISTISLFLRKHLNLIFPYLLTSLITLICIPFISDFGNKILAFLMNYHQDASVFDKVSFQMITAHMLWFFGVHGDNTYHILAPAAYTDYQVLEGLSSYNFFSIFVLLGGTGCLWGLIIACYLLKNAEHERSIARISAPLAVFNISEVMIYALPIVFNPYFLIPFLLAPIVNGFIAYQLIDHGLIVLSASENIPWFTPVLLSGWMITHSWTGIALQLVLIALNVAIYYPFVLANQRHNITGKALDMLVKRYSAGHVIEDKAEESFAKSHSEQHIEQYSLKTVTDALNSGALALYYQPKMDPLSQQIVGFEALLRLIKNDGEVMGPWFLATLEQHKLMHVIDSFVIDQLEVDLDNFARQGFHPKISFNISPQNLLADGYKRVVKAFSRFPNQVEVEILESSYIEDFESAIELVKYLNKHNIQCAMDDFGTGYSCLSVLSKLNINTIKLDRSLLPIDGNIKSAVLYQHLAKICDELGFKIVAEGVESKLHEDVVKKAHIQCAQGFLYNKALPYNVAVELLKKQHHR
ncbi:EAL domain-containing protein [Pseudoalteromonas sp. NEC-BIFX-2020_002]|uniref:EAL domain-containing protein n=1 Tax=Pseudoalteromonas sp. NEC-BIFX-2020_002 TaxID=2732353 RepID=UPI001BB1816D|nr:EAL domain-containing protein [Pseudoalteromonas sp. NEC-BIFX-2020_002]